ncbi:MAG: hypothetical protein WDM77_09810 [Steroidobacteraceae bacterium]
MRVNVYAEEMTDRIEIIEKQIGGVTFTGLRFYLELPASFVPSPQRQTMGTESGRRQCGIRCRQSTIRHRSSIIPAMTTARPSPSGENRTYAERCAWP